MCQLLGMNCNVPTDICFVPGLFAGAAVKPMNTATAGASPFSRARAAGCFSITCRRSISPIAELVQHYPIKSRNVIAHIRKATQGELKLANTHLFQRELWANTGFLPTTAIQRPAASDGQFRPVGDTDSEQAFCWLLDHHAPALCRKPPTLLLTAAIGGCFARLAEFGTFNCLLSNGELLFAHCTTNLHCRAPGTVFVGTPDRQRHQYRFQRADHASRSGGDYCHPTLNR